MYGDLNYSIFATGSTLASANTAHLLINKDLSQLNDADVGFLSLLPIGNNSFVYSTLSASNGVGIRFMSGGSNYIDQPPMSVDTISNLHFKNETDDSNAGFYWTMWKR